MSVESPVKFAQQKPPRGLRGCHRWHKVLHYFISSGSFGRAVITSLYTVQPGGLLTMIMRANLEGMDCPTCLKEQSSPTAQCHSWLVQAINPLH
ncbi:hypothetical protein BDV27DRAFT_131349 [Aspergillus caelatus]|uniref:Uncharacterized protein n=2 Tax=Aspergillus subgen. Circumdati TaxID=2720871 RepID=A0A5N6ZY43_9EURO|nr:uncharacterized protein BDV27DRAFT_131349 [Aspergillus caelatus]KAE8362521.1 hypothetical protein BDV27DRAFT_131349 [Aspergillus caelatus]KAE8418900.1 hypothetical protein BDV36DRAFT_252955 [Aspergillus pseudocaelatus]